MKLSSIVSMFMLLAVCSTNISAGGFWDSVRSYFFPKRGSLGDYAHFDQWGECRDCNLQRFNLEPIIEKHKNKKIDLEKANCIGANLSNVDLSRANLYGTKLNDANLENSNLEGANAWWAHLKRANMRNANMKKAKVYFAKLGKANLEGADLTDARISSTNMQNTNICNAQLDRAFLWDADFKGAKVNKKTSFDGAICYGTDFSNIKNLHKTDLEYSAHLDLDCKLEKAPTFLQKMRTQAKSIKTSFEEANRTKANLGDSEKQIPTPTQTMTAIMLGWLGS